MSLSVEQFVENLTRSGLLSETEISDFQGRLSPEQCKDAETLARELIRAKKLTKYQAMAVYQGKAKGLVLGEYVVLDKLGEGGMGAVLKAYHRRMKRLVAIKILPPSWTKSPENVERFLREVEAAARLVHPNVVTAYDAGRHEGIHYLVMEFIDGEDLATWLRRHGPMSVEQAIDCCLQAATGLQYANTKGVIHRDIKPGNLLLSREGTVKILDLGLAYLIATPAADDSTDVERLTVSGQVLGTCDYMAPEQAQNSEEADHRADIYSLGCTLYRLLTGQPPYRGRTLIQVVMAHCNAPIPSLCEARPEVPAALDAIFQKMVAKRPEDRYQSVAEVVAALTAFRKGEAMETSVAPPHTKPGASARQWILLLAGLVGLVVCGLIAAFVLAWTSRRASRPEGTPPGPSQRVSAASESAARPSLRLKKARPETTLDLVLTDDGHYLGTSGCSNWARINARIASICEREKQAAR